MKIIRRSNVDDSHLNALVADPILRQILARRGVKNNDDLEVSLKSIFPPDRLLDIGKASSIIADAIINKKRVLIAGDYDIDGMTGTALGVRCLKAFGLDEHLITYYVPSRYADGYGLNIKIVERAIASKVDLIVTVDNGITAFDAVDFAKLNGISVVITDHHEVQDRLPNADAVVDPKRKGDTFQSKNLCGAAVLFYVMSATRSRLIERGYYQCIKDSPSMGQFLDLVTLGTIGDVMSFDTNNRRLIKAGLKRISKGRTIPGIQALLSYLKIDPTKIRVKNISHELCPRFNAATRIKIAQNPAILNLTNDDYNLAMLFARQLDLCNKRRADHEKIMLARAFELYKEERLQSEQQLAQSSQAQVDLQALETASKEANKINSNEALVFSDEEDIADAYNQFDQVLTNSGHNNDDAGIVLYDESFLKGVSGLVANRMKERYNKPCIIFSSDNNNIDDSNINLMGVIDNNGSLTPPELVDEHGYKATLDSQTDQSVNQVSSQDQPNSQDPATSQEQAVSKDPALSISSSDSGELGATSASTSTSAGAGASAGANASASASAGAIEKDSALTQETNDEFDFLEDGGDSAIIGSTNEQSQASANKKKIKKGITVVSSAKLVSAASGPSMVNADQVESEQDVEYLDEGDIPLVGSARSVNGIDLMKVFEYIKSKEPKIFVACGGHAVAAGATIKYRDLARFKTLFSQGCAHAYHKAEEEEAIVSECQLPDAYLCLDFARDLEYFGPWGKDFEEPIFDGEFLVDQVTIIKNRHLKVLLRTKDNTVVEGIKFRANAKERTMIPNIKVKVVYTLGIDRFFANERLVLQISNIEPV